jgi:uncharacterized protein YeaO (DUF488 family)
MKASTVRIKRIYEPYHPEDGTRVFIDRLWARGLTKDMAHVELWLKDSAPSTELRKWFNHEPDKWNEFRKRYVAELKNNSNAINTLLKIAKEGEVTLVYGAKDEEYNDAVVSQNYINQMLK